MATKKGGGSTRNGRDSIGKRLGLKVASGQMVQAGAIIQRQRGSEIYPGPNVGMGKDFTLYSKVNGILSFKKGFKSRKFAVITPANDA